MGLLDMVTSALGNGLSGDTKKGSLLMNIVMQIIANPDSGGLQGLLKSLCDRGLSEQVSSWVSTGPNLPISADEIKGIFGTGRLEKIANQLGVSENETAGALADMLPKVIDKLTPDGQIPESDLLVQGLNMLKGKLFG